MQQLDPLRSPGSDPAPPDPPSPHAVVLFAALPAAVAAALAFPELVSLGAKLLLAAGLSTAVARLPASVAGCCRALYRRVAGIPGLLSATVRRFGPTHGR